MNTDENRPNPEDLLRAIKHEENTEKKGHLKIFLGMAAGVGKTFAMLEEAQKLTKSGINVVVGTIDTHDRKDTKELLEGLRIIPEKTVMYKDKEFKELDLDEIIKQKPDIVLVDELAHSNIPGLRHEKRWQDVMEILDNGINVYTTLNVQHVESLKDVVENITGIVIKETVPDLVVEEAAYIQVIDLNPDELVKRLNEGKVYLGDQSKIAILNFFKNDKLTALREILLRFTAEKIDHDLHQMISSADTENRWKPREKLLVAISPSPHSQKLIRTTRRLAFNLEAPWIAVYVDTGKTLNDEDETNLAKNITLARDLGAEVITTHDPDVATAISRIAKRRGVTEIIVGRSPKKRFFNLFSTMNLSDKLAKECTDVDILVSRQEALLTNHHNRLKAANQPLVFKPYFLVFLAVSFLAGVNLSLLPMIGHTVVGEIFFIGILFLSLFFKKGPVFFAALLFSFIWYIFFIPDEFKYSLESILLLCIYALTAITTGILVDRYREHQELLLKREETSQSLYRIIRQISASSSNETIFREVTERLKNLFGGPFEIIIKKIKGGLNFDKPLNLVVNEKEKAAASWVFENGKEAGWSTDTLPYVENLYIPIKNGDETYGILAYKKNLKKFPSLDEKNFLHTIAQQLATRIQRFFSEELSKQNELRFQIEKINKSILKRISTEFKPSLAEAKKSVKFFRQQLEEINDKSLTDSFSKIEVAYDHFTKVFQNISMMSETKDN